MLVVRQWPTKVEAVVKREPNSVTVFCFCPFNDTPVACRRDEAAVARGRWRMVWNGNIVVYNEAPTGSVVESGVDFGWRLVCFDRGWNRGQDQGVDRVGLVPLV